jgi:hypothetical protein
LEFNRDRVERNVRSADTEDLLDRVTAFRSGMEPEAIAIIEAELDRRGFNRAAIRDYEAARCAEVVRRPEGFAYRCSFCDRPAVERRWGWHRFWDVVPIFPRVMNYCRRHAAWMEPEPEEPPEEE